MDKVKLEGFYSEEALRDLKGDGKITTLQYVWHSQERRGEFEKYCKDNNLQHTEEAAEQFIYWLLLLEEQSHTDYLD